MTSQGLVGADDLAPLGAADRDARPARLGRLRARMEREGVDAYFGIRAEHARYLTGFELGDGEEKVAGNSGWFLVTADEVVLLADSRYAEQAREQCPDARIAEAYNDLPTRWPELVAGLRRVAAEADLIPQALWTKLATAAPSVELVAVEGWLAADRAVKEPAELERVAAACAVADAALERLLPSHPARCHRGASWRSSLEWEMRTNGAEALAFDVACLSGPRAALPHGSPGSREVRAGEVLLFDFGAKVAGYRSDMTRTLFVGEPRAEDLAIYELVRRAQQAAIGALAAAAGEGRSPGGRTIDGVARAVIEAAGHGEHFGHGLGHGIGLATHEAPIARPARTGRPVAVADGLLGRARRLPRPA